MPTFINPKATWDTYKKTLTLKTRELIADLDISIPVDLYGQEKKDGCTVVYDAAAGRWVLRPVTISEPVFDWIKLRDTDPTPTGDILLKNLDQVLHVRNASDTSYAPLRLSSLFAETSVGIGTTSPSAQLDVRATAAPEIRISHDEAIRGRIGIATAENAINPGSLKNSLVIANDAGALHLGSGGSVRATITTEGNVGIGTTSPTERLEVAGTIKVSGFIMPTGARAGYVLTSDASGVGTWQPPAAGGIGGSGSPGQVAFWTDTTTVSGDNNLFWDNANKRLGVKTTAPSSPLHIAGAIALATRTTTTNTALGENDCVLLCNASNGPITVSLPPAASAASRVYVIKKTDATINAVTVTPAPGEKIDAADAYTLLGGAMYRVFGPTTVTVDWGTTGDKTLLQISDGLPAGRKIVIFALGWDGATSVGAYGYLKIMRGATELVREGITHYLNYGGCGAKPVMLFAYDSNAPANATYTFAVTVTTAATGTSTLHVQGMVILLDKGAFFATGINTSIAAGATANIASVTTNYTSGKVVVLAYVIFGVTSTTTGHRLYSAGAMRILEGNTIVSSNQFQIGAWANTHPAYLSLAYLSSSPSATFTIQVYNNLGETSQAWAEIIAFNVDDGAFLDTGSVALVSGSQVTVGNLSTALSGEVCVIALAAAENTSTSNVVGFNAGDVVLQKDNSSTDQTANQRSWYFDATGAHGRSGVYPLFRVDSNVSSPSYQVKMTARASGFNGEAKIVAFTWQPPRPAVIIQSDGANWWVIGRA